MCVRDRDRLLGLGHRLDDQHRAECLLAVEAASGGTSVRIVGWRPTVGSPPARTFAPAATASSIFAFTRQRGLLISGPMMIRRGRVADLQRRGLRGICSRKPSWIGRRRSPCGCSCRSRPGGRKRRRRSRRPRGRGRRRAGRSAGCSRRARARCASAARPLGEHPPGLRGAGEVDAADRGVSKNTSAIGRPRRRVGDHVDGARRETGLLEDLGHQSPAESGASSEGLMTTVLPKASGMTRAPGETAPRSRA